MIGWEIGTKLDEWFGWSDAIGNLATDPALEQGKKAIEEIVKTLDEARKSAEKFKKGGKLGFEEQNEMIAKSNKLVAEHSILIGKEMKLEVGRTGQYKMSASQEIELNKQINKELKKQGMLSLEDIAIAKEKQGALIETTKNLDGETKAIEKRNQATEKGKSIKNQIKIRC
jgi:hypothetical protein